MHSQADLAEGSSSKHLYRPVEIRGGFGRISLLKERFPNDVRQLNHLPGPWRKVPVSVLKCVSLGCNEFSNLLRWNFANGKRFMRNVKRPWHGKVFLLQFILPVDLNFENIDVSKIIPLASVHCNTALSWSFSLIIVVL